MLLYFPEFKKKIFTPGHTEGLEHRFELMYIIALLEQYCKDKYIYN